MRRRQNDLAGPATRFIGRAADIAAITKILADGGRLVTVWGPAGMGKTRLSIEIGRAWAAARPDEAVRFCEVEAARDLRALCGAVARALGGPATAAKKDAGAVERVGRLLAAEGPLLVVLDNLEQVVEHAAPAIEAWLLAAPDARFLATSRERLRIDGETSYELSPLGLPNENAAASTSEAVELFLDRARAVSPIRPLGEESTPKIAALVRRLEGIPLAIELAAARVDVLGLDGLASRLGKRLDLLGGGRGAKARQATLRGAIEWSWDLLDEVDRRALAHCSVFRGGFGIEAAEAVVGEAALDRVQSLRDKSLLRVVSRDPSEAPRFRLYEGVRELAEEKLEERGEVDRAMDRHAAWFLAHGESAAAEWEGTGALAALDRVGDDLPNLLAVAERALARDGSRAAVEQAVRALLAVDPLLVTRGPFGLHVELLERAIEASEGGDALLVARAVAARGRARHLGGNDAAAIDDLGAARDRAAALGDAAIEASALTDLGVIHHRRREVDEARACYEAALARRSARGDQRAEGRLLGNLGALHHDERRFDEAKRHYERAIALAAAAGDLRTAGIFSGNLGLIEQERSASAEARRRFEGAIAMLEEVGDPRLLGITLGNLGMMHHEEGRVAEARACHERAVGLLREAGDRRSEALAAARHGAALASLDRLDEARAAFGRGDRLLLHQGDPLAIELVAVARGFLDLALARSARVAARTDEATSHLAEARRRIDRARDEATSFADRSDDVRLAARILSRSLAAMDGSDAASTSELLLAPEARWLRAPGGTWQDLRERHAVRRLLLLLAERRRDAPGRGVSLAELQEAGWPGERILPQAASNRIYVAVNQLRKLGLKDWLQRNGEGYFLDPALAVHRTGVEPVADRS